MNRSPYEFLRRLFSIAGFLFVFIGSVNAAPEDVSLYPNDGWVWRFAPILGPQQYDGTVRVESLRGDATSSLDDIADRATFQMAFLVDGHGDRMGLFFDLSYLALNADYNDGTRVGNFSASLLSVDTLGSVGFGPWDMGSTSSGFELLGGGRWNQFEAEIETKNAGSADSSRGWVDPVVGGRITTNFDFPLRVEIRSDWGGFGVGSATDLTWRFFGLAHFKVDPALELFGGYRVSDIKSQHQNGDRGTALDGHISGPVIGITFLLG